MTRLVAVNATQENQTMSVGVHKRSSTPKSKLNSALKAVPVARQAGLERIVKREISPIPQSLSERQETSMNLRARQPFQWALHAPP